MSDYQPMSAPPPPQGGPQRDDAPPAIRRAVMLVWAVVAVSVLNTVLSFVFLDELVDAALGSGAEGLTEETARSGAVVGGVFGLIFAALWVVLGVMLGRGASWARIVLTVLAGIGVAFGLFNLTLGTTPLVFTLVGAVTLVLEVALLYCLWQSESTAFLRGRPAR